jgi:hypothetical protein
MEKRSDWNVGDLIRFKGSRLFYKISGFMDNSEGITIVQLTSYWYNCPTSYPLMFLDNKFINYGIDKEKVINALYGTKSKDSSNKLSNKG